LTISSVIGYNTLTSTYPIPSFIFDNRPFLGRKECGVWVVVLDRKHKDDRN